MIAVLQSIAGERAYTAIHEPWPVAEQERHMRSLKERETIHVAEDGDRNMAGYQSLELWAPTLTSMSHVGQVGTFVGREWRRQGIGAKLFALTLEFAAKHAYEKFVIMVRAGNTAGQAFYRQLGFRECGRLARQVRIDGREDDEILMEYFL